MGGWRWRAGRSGKPRLRRSFALPAPGLPGEPVYGARDRSRKKERRHERARFLLGRVDARRMRGWRWSAGRSGKPRLRRSFALPAPRLPAEPVHGARDHSRKKNGETGSQGSCSAESTLAEMLGGDVAVRGRRGKPRLRRSFALPAPSASGGACSSRATTYSRKKNGEPHGSRTYLQGRASRGRSNN